MTSQKVIITNPAGMHLRLARKVCEKAREYTSDSCVLHGTGSADAKSLLNLLGACIKYRDEVEFIFIGPDEEEALAAMLEMLFLESSGEVPPDPAYTDGKKTE